MQTENHNYAGGKVFIWISVDFFFQIYVIKIFVKRCEMLSWNGENLNEKKKHQYIFGVQKSGQFVTYTLNKNNY